MPSHFSGTERGAWFALLLWINTLLAQFVGSPYSTGLPASPLLPGSGGGLPASPLLPGSGGAVPAPLLAFPLPSGTASLSGPQVSHLETGMDSSPALTCAVLPHVLAHLCGPLAARVSVSGAPCTVQFRLLRARRAGPVGRTPMHQALCLGLEGTYLLVGRVVGGGLSTGH